MSGILCRPAADAGAAGEAGDSGGVVAVRNMRRRVALAAAVVLFGAVIATAGPAEALGCTQAQLVPQLREFSVNQGLPSYGAIARGKDAVVKLYVSLPDCASGTGSTISLRSASNL